MKRRSFLQGLGTLSAGAVLPVAAARAAVTSRTSSGSSYVAPVPADTGAAGRVIVIGGGMAGATAAKYLRVWGGKKVEVTLIERAPVYVSNILSNLVLNDGRTVASLSFNWDKLVSNYGVVRQTGEVVGVDPIAKNVVLGDGQKLNWDRLVIAPGLDFDPITGIETPELQAQFPHAWRAGPQTETLRSQLRTMPAGGTVIITIPKAPYRGGSAPYARASLIADWLKRNKPASKVIVLDANPAIVAEPIMFTQAFNVTHAGVISYVPNAVLERIDPATRTVYTSAGPFTGDVINPIPAQRAPKFLLNSGLINDPNPVIAERRWISVDAKSYEHLAAPNIHVIGDPVSHGMPKAGHVANQQAKVCADAVTRMLRGDRPDDSPITNSVAFSPVSTQTSSWQSSVFRYNPTTRKMEVVNGGVAPASAESGAATQDNFDTMNKWFRQLMNDSFA